MNKVIKIYKMVLYYKTGYVIIRVGVNNIYYKEERHDL